MNAQPQQSVLIMAGGTGGHIFPGISVATELQRRGWKAHWLGARNGMEEKLVRQHGIDLNLISIAGLRGKGIKGWLLAPYNLSRAVVEAIKIIRKVKPGLVIGFGGFASGPGGLAAFLTRTHLITHEQNAIAGLTNRVLGRLAKHIFQAFPGAFKQSKKVTTVGNPLRSEILKLNQLQETHENNGPVNILVMGGSRGALALNRYLPTMFSKLLKQADIKVIHQVGANRLKDSEEFYANAKLLVGSEIQVVEFIDDMAAKLSWADIVICRSGASTVSEIAAAGKCAIFIPFPYAVDDHQTANAQWLVKQNAALLFTEAALKETAFLEEITRLVKSPQRIQQIAENAKMSAYLNAAGLIADYCDELRTKAG